MENTEIFTQILAVTLPALRPLLGALRDSQLFGFSRNIQMASNNKTGENSNTGTNKELLASSKTQDTAAESTTNGDKELSGTESRLDTETTAKQTV